MHITTSHYVCSSCGHSFYAPALSDFLYGQFVFTSTSGKYYAYLNALDDPVFREVKEIIKTKHPLLMEDALNDKSWRAFSNACDPAPDQTLFKMGVIECPQCRRKNTLIRNLNEDGAIVDTPEITHVEWGMLNEQERRSRVLAVE